ncbi:MAG: biotin/lipoyl-binding protein [Bryobacterales bacterium]|nr:biotin/lipoyl-binding protein [Bryobacterales bacterium]
MPARQPDPRDDAADRQPTSRDAWLLIIGLLLVLAIFTGTGYYAWHRHKTSQAAEATKAAAEAAARAAQEYASGAELTFSGDVKARNVLPIAAPMDGTVETVDVVEGAVVEQNQPLARIKNEGLATEHANARQDLEKAAERVNTLESTLIAARLEASRAAAEADRARGEADRFDRTARREEMLYKEGATPRLRFEKAQAEATAAAAQSEAAKTTATQANDRVARETAELEAAKRILDEKTREVEGAQGDLDAAAVNAPVDGVVIAVKVKPGDEVSEAASTDIFQIAVAADELQVPIEPQDPKAAAVLKDGLPALVEIVELSMQGISGELKRTDSGGWRVDFKAPDASVKPGLHAVVRVKLP